MNKAAKISAQSSTHSAVDSPADSLVAGIRRALATVVDPEAGVDIVALGLVYRIACSDAAVEIDLTMTSPTCPMGEMILDDARAAVESVLPPGMPLHLSLVWEPPWTPERMSERARLHFGWDGD
jgi:metal-sulfur cluster biosynthetic enzyme